MRKSTTRFSIQLQLSEDNPLNLTIVVVEDGGWFVAQSKELDVASQGNSPEEALANLKEAISLHLQSPAASAKACPESVWDDLPGRAPETTFRALRFRLEEAGFKEVVQKGNHAKFIRRLADGINTAVLPHYTWVASITVSSILRQAELSKEEI